jgi:hypothetical protein
VTDVDEILPPLRGLHPVVPGVFVADRSSRFGRNGLLGLDLDHGRFFLNCGILCKGSLDPSHRDHNSDCIGHVVPEILPSLHDRSATGLDRGGRLGTLALHILAVSFANLPRRGDRIDSPLGPSLSSEHPVWPISAVVQLSEKQVFSLCHRHGIP